MFEQREGWEYNDSEEIRKVNWLLLSPRATQTTAADPEESGQTPFCY